MRTETRNPNWQNRALWTGVVCVLLMIPIPGRSSVDYVCHLAKGAFWTTDEQALDFAHQVIKDEDREAMELLKDRAIMIGPATGDSRVYAARHRGELGWTFSFRFAGSLKTYWTHTDAIECIRK